MKPRILFVDDDADLRRLLGLRLASAGYEVETAASGLEALGRVSDFQPDLVVTDIQMDGMDGMALFEALRRRSPTLPVVILTAHGTIPDALDATRKGVFGYLTKPFDSQALLGCVRDALRLTRSAGEAPEEWRSDLLSCSPLMDDVIRRARLIADSDASVMILGESGTGKEVMAKAIHRASRRKDRPFVAVNCAGDPREPPRVRAVRSPSRIVQRGDRGPPGPGAGRRQGHVVPGRDWRHAAAAPGEDVAGPGGARGPAGRGHEEHRGRRPGAERDPRRHRARRTEGRFRDDLFFRLNVVTLNLPALVERREDVPLLATKFLEGFSTRDGRPAESFAPDAMDLMVARGGRATSVSSGTWSSSVSRSRRGRLIPASLVQDALRDRPGDAPDPRRRPERGRAGVPGAHPPGHERQRDPGGAARRTEPHRVLQAPRYATRSTRSVIAPTSK